MQTPICENCLKTNELCENCSNKLIGNEITQQDVDVSRTIYELSQKVKSLENINLIKTIDATVLTVVCGLGDGPMLVGRGGSVVKVLAKKFKKNIKIIEYHKNFEEFVKKLLEPAEIKSISSVFSPEGQYYKIKLLSQEQANIGFTDQCLEKIFTHVCHTKAQICYEG